jgi:hypothetical protein
MGRTQAKWQHQKSRLSTSMQSLAYNRNLRYHLDVLNSGRKTHFRASWAFVLSAVYATAPARDRKRPEFFTPNAYKPLKVLIPKK